MNTAESRTIGRVYIVVLNWNNWEDTIECLESLQCLDYHNYRVVVVDNGSTDDSVERIKQWAEGRLKIESPFIDYDVEKKPLFLIEYDKVTAETGGYRKLESKASEFPCSMVLTVIRSEQNLGYAAGNNIGLRYALSRGDLRYAWILNNDTVVESHALTYLVERAAKDIRVGLCGSTLLFYYQPDTVQAWGGAKYNKWLGTTVAYGLGHSAKDQPPDKLEEKFAYIVGASVLVTEEFLKEIGLMTEDYFLYFEELDWAIRAKERFCLAYAPGSLVYHKEGGTTGGGQDPVQRSKISDYWSIRNRILFTKRYFPFTLPTVYLGLIVAILNRIRRCQWDRVGMIIKHMLALY
jgi:GT2 family glycosyltransferase